MDNVTKNPEGLTYFSNYNSQSFQTNKPREFNRLKDDECDIKQRNFSNDKKLKFVTTSFRDLMDAKEQKNFFGIDIVDKLFVPSDKMDEDSQLRHGKTGNVLTNLNVKYELGGLPLPTTPGRYRLYHGDVDIEDNMRNFVDTNKPSCNPRDTEYHNRSFYIFEGIEKPEAIKSVEKELRCGISTRYMNGVKGSKKQ